MLVWLAAVLTAIAFTLQAGFIVFLCTRAEVTHCTGGWWNLVVVLALGPMLTCASRLLCVCVTA